MLGRSILVAPKLKEPTSDQTLNREQEVEYTLPDSELWYNYYTKQREDHPK